MRDSRAGLAAFPGLVRRLPKTGPASEILKQTMAFFMLAAAAYFIGIGLNSLAADSAEPARYLPALRRIRHAGVTADIEFDANGDLKEGLLSIFRVQGGKWVLQ